VGYRRKGCSYGTLLGHALTRRSIPGAI
jgi:hypothetical protein